MNERMKKILESVGTTQSRRRRRDRAKQDAADAVLESTRGARPSDALAGVEVQDEPAGMDPDAIAPIMGVNGEGPESLDGVDVQAAPGEEVEINQETIDAAVEKVGLKPVSLDGVDMDALEKGTEHEMEHVEDRTVAAAIAAHHIMGRPDYYEKLEAAFAEDPTGPTPDDEYQEISPDSFGGVDAEGDEDEEGKIRN